MIVLPAAIEPRAFDELHDDPARWQDVVASIAAAFSDAPARPVGDGTADRLPRWDTFLASQRQRCRRRQQRTGLPARLLERLETFLEGDVPAGSAVILTGEYTPMNLLHGPGGIVGMFDFGDGLVGPREYDWLGPLCFLAAGHAARCDAFFAGYGVAFDRRWRLPLLRLLLLHRYSALRLQIAHPGWEQAPDFEALAALIWP